MVQALQASISSTLEARGTHVRASRHLVRNDQNRKRAELGVKSNLINALIMYALDSAHEKVRRLKRGRSFAVLFGEPGQIERQVETDTNLSSSIESNVEL